VTEFVVTQRCRWCGRRFDLATGPGRPRQFCRPGCRQQAHIARKLAAAHGLGCDDVIINRDALEELQGALYCLQAAIQDVDQDLQHADGPDDVQAALHWLLDNARPLADLWIQDHAAHVTEAPEALDITDIMGGYSSSAASRP